MRVYKVPVRRKVEAGENYIRIVYEDQQQRVIVFHQLIAPLNITLFDKGLSFLQRSIIHTKITVTPSASATT